MTASQSVPTPCRNHVHIFLFNGLDPLNASNLTGLCDYLHSLGYIKTHFGQMYHYWEFKDDLIRIHEEDAQARFVVIGFSLGCNFANALCHAAEQQGITVDLLAFFSGTALKNSDEYTPANALHIVNVLSRGRVLDGVQLDTCVNIKYEDVGHFGSPTHPQSLRMLAEELAQVAARVSLIEPEPPPLRHDEEGPTPR
ncbi:MAG: hypothetical protein ACRD36_02220, partial [Candidatus Acidiferrum sp.]